MKYWYFQDYIDQAGINVIEEWLNKQPMAVRNEINTRISYLAVMRELRMPYVRTLKGECDGLFELRIKYKNIQYRPLGCYGPGKNQVTLLMGAIEKGGKFDPLSACKTALLRKVKIHETGRIHEHSFEEPKSTCEESSQ